MTDVTDLRPTIVPKSDQLNAEQLLGGPMTITVTGVKVSSNPEQPVSVHYEGEQGRPFRPCKTMRKLLVFAWGPDGNEWAGRSMTVYNDLSVKFGGDEVGGIRISHLSHIPKAIEVSLTSTRGKKALYRVALLETTDAKHLKEMRTAADLDTLAAAFKAAWKSTTSEARRESFKLAYDRRKAELAKPVIDPDDAPDVGADVEAPVVTFASVADKIARAKTLDALDEAAGLIGAVANVEQQRELSEKFDARRVELQ